MRITYAQPCSWLLYGYRVLYQHILHLMLGECSFLYCVQIEPYTNRYWMSHVRNIITEPQGVI